MSAYNSGLLAGVLTGIMILAVIVLYKRSNGIGPEDEYDERQLIARNKAYKGGFFALLCAVAVDMFLQMAGVVWCEQPLGELTAIMIGVVVFACRTILDDAFFGHTERRRVFIFYAAMVVLQFFTTWRKWKEGSLIADGRLTMDATGMICGLAFLVVLIVLLLKSRRNQDEEED